MDGARGAGLVGVGPLKAGTPATDVSEAVLDRVGVGSLKAGTPALNSR